jgi:hypothetical protein
MPGTLQGPHTLVRQGTSQGPHAVAKREMDVWGLDGIFAGMGEYHAKTKLRRVWPLEFSASGDDQTSLDCEKNRRSHEVIRNMPISVETYLQPRPLTVRRPNSLATSMVGQDHQYFDQIRRSARATPKTASGSANSPQMTQAINLLESMGTTELKEVLQGLQRTLTSRYAQKRAVPSEFGFLASGSVASSQDAGRLVKRSNCESEVKPTLQQGNHQRGARASRPSTVPKLMLREANRQLMRTTSSVTRLPLGQGSPRVSGEGGSVGSGYGGSRRGRGGRGSDKAVCIDANALVEASCHRQAGPASCNTHSASFGLRRQLAEVTSPAKAAAFLNPSHLPRGSARDGIATGLRSSRAPVSAATFRSQGRGVTRRPITRSFDFEITE